MQGLGRHQVVIDRRGQRAEGEFVVRGVAPDHGAVQREHVVHVVVDVHVVLLPLVYERALVPVRAPPGLGEGGADLRLILWVALHALGFVVVETDGLVMDEAAPFPVRAGPFLPKVSTADGLVRGRLVGLLDPQLGLAVGVLAPLAVRAGPRFRPRVAQFPLVLVRSLGGGRVTSCLVVHALVLGVVVATATRSNSPFRPARRLSPWWCSPARCTRLHPCALVPRSLRLRLRFRRIRRDGAFLQRLFWRTHLRRAWFSMYVWVRGMRFSKRRNGR